MHEDKQVNRFLMILSMLYRANPEGFSSATEVSQGRSRVYALEVAELRLPAVASIETNSKITVLGGNK